MSIIDRLRTRSVKPAKDGTPLKTETDLFRAVYGDAQSTRQGTVITVATDAEADRLMGQPLSEAQRAGLAAQVQLNR